MTVVIVEDNARVRRLLRHAVGGIASAVWECGDVVLMDIRMPRLDGLAATRQIRQFDPSARVVMVTDYEDEELFMAASEAGACG